MSGSNIFLCETNEDSCSSKPSNFRSFGMPEVIVLRHHWLEITKRNLFLAHRLPHTQKMSLSNLNQTCLRRIIRSCHWRDLFNFSSALRKIWLNSSECGNCRLSTSTNVEEWSVARAPDSHNGCQHWRQSFVHRVVSWNAASWKI